MPENWKKIMEHVDDGDVNSIWRTWNSHQDPGK